MDDVQLVLAVKQCHEKGVCHGKSCTDWNLSLLRYTQLEKRVWSGVQKSFLIGNALILFCVIFLFIRWYQVWECTDYILELALPCRLCIFQTHLHSIWWPIWFLFFLWHWGKKTLLSSAWGWFLFLYLFDIFLLFILFLSCLNQDNFVLLSSYKIDPTCCLVYLLHMIILDFHFYLS